MTAGSVEAVFEKALELAGDRGPGGPDDPRVRELVEAAGKDREVLEQARNEMAGRLRTDSRDWTATGALGLLNKALVQVGWSERFDWRGRLGNSLRRP